MSSGICAVFVVMAIRVESQEGLKLVQSSKTFFAFLCRISRRVETEPIVKPIFRYLDFLSRISRRVETTAALPLDRVAAKLTQ